MATTMRKTLRETTRAFDDLGCVVSVMGVVVKLDRS
jgi:hypothetical protein